MRYRTLIAVAACLLLGAHVAKAEQITTGAGPADSWDIIGASNHITAFTTGFLTPALLGASDVGTATWGSTTIMAGPPASGVFPVTSQTPWTVSFTFPDATVSGTLDITEIDDGSLNPHLKGTYIPLTDTGALASAGDMNVDVEFGTLAGSLEVFTGFDYPAALSSGEFVFLDTLPGVSEPSSMRLLGTGLLGLVGPVLIRRCT